MPSPRCCCSARRSTRSSAEPTSAPASGSCSPRARRSPSRSASASTARLTPVWEANHVWLIFILVVLWTGFPEAFSAVMTTLYIPLALAALGIVLRGAGFAFRHVVRAARTLRVGQPRLRDLLDPDAVLHGHRRRRDRGRARSRADGNGDPTASWTGPLPLLIGAMFVAIGAYIAAVFLVHDSRGAGEPEVEAPLPPLRPGRRAGRRRARGRRGLRAARRRPLRLRRPHGSRAAAGDRLRPRGAGGAGAAGAGRAATGSSPWRCGPWRWARWRWWSGAGASRSTPTCCRPRGARPGSRSTPRRRPTRP